MSNVQWKHEIRMSKEARSTKNWIVAIRGIDSSFGHSCFFRHSCFVLDESFDIRRFFSHLTFHTDSY